MGFPGGTVVKNPPASAGDKIQVRSLAREDLLEAQGNQSLSRELRASALCPGLEAQFPARRWSGLPFPSPMHESKKVKVESL